ncbi:mechanosensitive ion channel family protein [Halomicronema sp. CCY15110]|uniref:mechanosensitive ion channel family protein n=1 Tax=Halomicronema sp. CCY15110 TaxID=2767773 RepID=UPI001EF36EF3|nr:mechanosensitive ion channel family protein [Halomicronema sp. CCY15110]
MGRQWSMRLSRCMVGLLLGILLAVGLPDRGAAQNNGAIAEPAPASTATTQAVFFADVLVRGQPVLQVGSVGELSATERAQQISRRIAGLVQQPQPLDAVQVRYDNPRNLATLQLNNRVIMTVTPQDALDFDTTVEVLAQEWSQKLNAALEQPNLVVEVVGRLEGTLVQLRRSILNNLSSMIGALLVLLFTWLAAMGVSRGSYLWAEKTEGDRATEILISRLSYGGVWLLGSVIALGVLGLNFAALLGTLGLTSVAIGFGLKDIVSNYLSGLILLATRPFRIGDEVVINQYEGRVVQVQLRVTTVQTYDGRQVYIPNQEVFQSSITNNTASPVRRSSMLVGIDYEADLKQAKGEILDAIASIDGIEAEPAPLVLVQELAASTVNLEILFWVNSRRKSFLQVTSEVRQAVKERLETAGIEMPTDIYTLNFRNQPPFGSFHPGSGTDVQQP